jgi:hypothetical protein
MVTFAFSDVLGVSPHSLTHRRALRPLFENPRVCTAIVAPAVVGRRGIGPHFRRRSGVIADTMHAAARIRREDIVRQ